MGSEEEGVTNREIKSDIDTPPYVKQIASV